MQIHHEAEPHNKYIKTKHARSARLSRTRITTARNAFRPRSSWDTFELHGQPPKQRAPHLRVSILSSAVVLAQRIFMDRNMPTAEWVAKCAHVHIFGRCKQSIPRCLLSADSGVARVGGGK